MLNINRCQNARIAIDQFIDEQKAPVFLYGLWW